MESSRNQEHMKKNRRYCFLRLPPFLMEKEPREYPQTAPETKISILKMKMLFQRFELFLLLFVQFAS